jgi:hypothetical protein
VFSWGGGSQSVFLDSRAAVTSGTTSTAARNNAGMAFGGILTGEGGVNRRFVGDLSEVRFYDASMSAQEAAVVIRELNDLYVAANVPRILSFTATTNQIYLGNSVTLAWNVTNANSVVIDNGVGAVAASGSRQVSPTNTTTYSLTATNTNAVRTASLTVIVDPGVPIASSLVTNTPRNTPVSLALRGSDPNGGALTYSLVAPPLHGALTGTLPNVIYTPTNNYDGSDSFTFKVNDGTFDSAPATVTIKVIPPPVAPTGIVLSSTNISSAAGPGSFVAALRAIDPNEGDTHTFTLVPGFGDNARFSMSGNLLNTGPAFAGGPGARFSVRLRATDNTGLTFEQTVSLSVVDVPQTVVINELHYNPDFNPSRESFIELHNPTDAAIDVSLWRLRGGVDYFIPANTFIAARGFLVVAENPGTISNRFGVQRSARGAADSTTKAKTSRSAIRATTSSMKSSFAPNSRGPSPRMAMVRRRN